jgi:hypothetical protein
MRKPFLKAVVCEVGTAVVVFAGSENSDAVIDVEPETLVNGTVMYHPTP